jgi:hypothetical protein
MGFFGIRKLCLFNTVNNSDGCITSGLKISSNAWTFSLCTFQSLISDTTWHKLLKVTRNLVHYISAINLVWKIGFVKEESRMWAFLWITFCRNLKWQVGFIFAESSGVQVLNELTNGIRDSIDRKWIKIVHVVAENLPHSNMKFYLYFAHFCV